MASLQSVMVKMQFMLGASKDEKQTPCFPSRSALKNICCQFKFCVFVNTTTGLPLVRKYSGKNRHLSLEKIDILKKSGKIEIKTLF